MDIPKYNRQAWDRQVAMGNAWTRPVDAAVIAAARKGEWSLLLTPLKPVPRAWFPDDLSGRKVLCLASGGGQQGPVLAVAGADVTVFDNSPAQLAQDNAVASRDGLAITTELGDMRDLSRFAEGAFDLVFHPCSNTFIESIRPVWREAHRVLKPGGSLLSGFANPVEYIFDLKAFEAGELVVRHSIPYADMTDLSADELRELVLDRDDPVCFGHTLADQIQGQIEAGFVIAGFYEDKSGEGPLDEFIDAFIATRAIKAGDGPA
jgi:SAM-dependent methyltransferase